ncbi:MAG: TlpA family protein disulfide reductase [Verrucomicrobiales bacterium]|nr:TlpA family protein disulfide reductase [Verrucomicrobiales bacterium]
MDNHWPAPLACAVALIVSACTNGDKLPPTPSIAPRPAPNFSIQTIDGKPLNSANLKGKIVLLNFWSVWSPTCAREIPDLRQLRDSFDNGQEHIAIVGICVESNNLDDLASFMQEIGIDYPVSLQENDFAGPFGGIDAIPSTFVIDPGWNIVNRYTGKIFLKELRYELEYLLEKIEAEKAAGEQR